MKNTNKKLQLNKEVISQLNNVELSDIKGGKMRVYILFEGPTTKIYKEAYSERCPPPPPPPGGGMTSVCPKTVHLKP